MISFSLDYEIFVVGSSLALTTTLAIHSLEVASVANELGQVATHFLMRMSPFATDYAQAAAFATQRFVEGSSIAVVF